MATLAVGQGFGAREQHLGAAAPVAWDPVVGPMEVIIDDLLEVGAAMLDSSKSVERALPICPVLK